MPPILTPTLGVVLILSSLLAGSIAFLWVRQCGATAVQAMWNAVEVVFTVLIGSLAARAFVGSLLALQPFGDAGAGLVAWAFLFWPGIIDALVRMTSGRGFVLPADVLVWATVSGGLAGFWDGLRQIHDWRRFHGLTFLLDVTWGGAATSIGVAAHFLNLGWGEPIDSYRLGAHRYDAGVCTHREYAISLGNVCGNLRGRGDGPLFRHESIHVLQNRIFGPIYLFSYLFWMAALLIPALIWGLVVGRPGEAIYGWCYANNPWEEWAYRYGGSRPGNLIWPTRRIVVVSVTLALLAVFALSRFVMETAAPGASSS